MNNTTNSNNEDNARKKAKARSWVNGYVAAGSALVVSVCHIPGMATGVCMTIEGIMCYQIGRIYRGNEYSMHDATATAAGIGLTSLVGTIIAVESSALLGPLGWPIKGALSASLIKALGELIIGYFESMEK